jgi:hypothetical protein
VAPLAHDLVQLYLLVYYLGIRILLLLLVVFLKKVSTRVQLYTTKFITVPLLPGTAVGVSGKPSKGTSLERGTKFSVIIHTVYYTAVCFKRGSVQPGASWGVCGSGVPPYDLLNSYGPEKRLELKSL